MKKILITGANGQVGREFQALAPNADFDFCFVDIAELDITNAGAVRSFFDQNALDFCVNCAAYTAVDKAESDSETARKVNVDGVGHLAENCARKGIPLVHLSTDYVYHNDQNRPFKEDDPVHPRGVYAQTKLEGDRLALRLHPQTLILRTSWVYSAYGHNFVKTMLRLGRERDQLTVIFDQIGTPTWARDIAETILFILEKIQVDATDAFGVFHYSNEGVTSWYDFAKAIFELTETGCKVLPIETKDYPTPASRPPFSVLNKGKIKARFGLEIPHWRDSLKACLRQLGEYPPVTLPG